MKKNYRAGVKTSGLFYISLPSLIIIVNYYGGTATVAESLLMMHFLLFKQTNVSFQKPVQYI